MAKARSPGYPIISLGEAIEKISLVYKKDYQNKVPRTVVAQHMGYQGLNGKSLGVLSSVSKFGLLEGRGDENWVSDLALQIIAHEPDSSEWHEAVLEASTTPDLFAELKARFPTGGSDAALRSYLLTRKFLPAAAEIAIRTYRDTMQLVSTSNAANVTREAADVTRGVVPPTSVQTIVPNQTSPNEPSSLEQVEAAREYMRHSLSPECEVRLYVTGKMTSKELRKLRQLIYLSEVWESETEREAPSGAAAVEESLDRASKPST